MLLLFHPKISCLKILVIFFFFWEDAVNFSGCNNHNSSRWNPGGTDLRRIQNDSVFFPSTVRLFLGCGVKVGGEKCLLSQQPLHTMNPSPLGKYKKRNRIMHVFLKFAFMITLNFVYYYLCIIEIECTLFFTKAPGFIVIYILWVAKLFLQPSHILKTIFFLKKW